MMVKLFLTKKTINCIKYEAISTHYPVYNLRDYIKYAVPKTSISEWWAAWGIIPKNGGWEGLLEIYIKRLG